MQTNPLQSRSATVRFRAVSFCLILFGALATEAHALSSACAGDCDQDGKVTIHEVTLGIGVSLEREALQRCSVLDSDATGRVEVHEIVAALRDALCGCGVRCSVPPNPHQIVEIFELLPSPFPVAATIGQSAMIDLNGDAQLDEVAIVSCMVRVALGPDFQMVQEVTVDLPCAVELNVEDAFVDGRPDIVVLLEDGSIRVFRGSENGSFMNLPLSYLQEKAIFVRQIDGEHATHAMTDLNLDGYAETISIQDCAVLITLGSSSDQAPQTVQVDTHGACARGVVVEDPDGDGYGDLKILITD